LLTEPAKLTSYVLPALAGLYKADVRGADPVVSGNLAHDTRIAANGTNLCCADLCRRSTSDGFVASVVCVASKNEMFGVHTGRRVAGMADNLPCRDSAPSIHVCEAMRSVLVVSDSELAVAVAVPAPRPDETFAFPSGLCCETRCLGF